MARKTQKRTPQNRRGSKRRGADRMVFARRNYILLGIGVAMIVIGYTVMRIENEMDGFISLYVAPLIILGGYLEVIYAILWRPRETRVQSAEESQG